MGWSWARRRRSLSAPVSVQPDLAPGGRATALKIARNALGVLGGRVAVTPGTNGGTLFTLTLPRAKDRARL